VAAIDVRGLVVGWSVSGVDESGWQAITNENSARNTTNTALSISRLRRGIMVISNEADCVAAFIGELVLRI